MNLKNMLGQIEANGRDRGQIGDRLSHGWRSSEGCSTTTILAQLSIEPDAGAGAVNTITLTQYSRSRSRFGLAATMVGSGYGRANDIDK